MRLEFSWGVVRDLRMGDGPDLAFHADHYEIWQQLRDRFPHPYTEDDARRWLAAEVVRDPRTQFAIDHEGHLIGGIGLVPGSDVERVGAEIGYWLTPRYSGRGWMSEVVASFTRWVVPAFRLHRVYAIPFARNTGSCRVLQKAGFRCEGVMRCSALKEGELLDQVLYARVFAERGVYQD